MPLFLCWGDTWSDVWSDIFGGAKTKRVIRGDIWSDKISLFFMRLMYIRSLLNVCFYCFLYYWIWEVYFLKYLFTPLYFKAFNYVSDVYLFFTS